MNLNYTTIEKCLRAFEDVLAHRREDKDGNYVCWLGETSFLLCEDALEALRNGLSDEKPNSLKDAAERLRAFSKMFSLDSRQKLVNDCADIVESMAKQGTA